MSKFLCRVLGHRDKLVPKHIIERSELIFRVFPQCERCGRFGWGYVKRASEIVDEMTAAE